MKNLILLFLVLSSLNLMAQKSGKETLLNSNLAGKIVKVITGDKVEKFEEQELHLINRNDKYTGAYYALTIYIGSPSELLDFLTELEKFSNDHAPNDQTKIQNRVVKYEKMLGYNTISVYEEDGLGYHAYRKKDIVKLRKWMEDWISNNG